MAWSSATPESCWAVAAATYMPIKCIYCHKHHCCSNMPTGWVMLQDVCLLGLCHSILHVSWCCHTWWYGVSLSVMPAGVVPHYRPYLLMWCLNISPVVLVWCLSIGHAFCCGASLQAMPSGVVSHYQPCLLVCCFPIGHAFWRGVLLSTMPIGVLPHYRPCLLVWCLIINHACWCGSSL